MVIQQNYSTKKENWFPVFKEVNMLIIDRFESNMAVIECNDQTINIPIAELPNSAQAGDVLKIIIDEEKTKFRKEKIEGLADSLFE